MAQEPTTDAPSLISGISTDRDSELLLKRVKALFFLAAENYGTIESPTKEGFVEIAKLGKDVWNKWRNSYPTATADFSHTDFREIPIDFSGFVFSTSNEFEEKKSVDFTHSIFGDSAHFNLTMFGDRADFSHIKFGKFATFYRSIFGNYANFKNASFDNCPYFTDTHFGDFTNFDGTTFGMAANFRAVALGNHATFRGAEFLGWVDFSASTDIDESLEKSRFQSISFAGSIFKGKSNFTGRKFESTTDFGPLSKSPEDGSIPSWQPTKFDTAPTFHGCKFHQDTSFDDAKFEAPPSPEAARAYRTLKLAMEQLKATREEQKFFRLEMKAEHPSLPRGKRWISTLYSLFSDYGFSLWRPIVALLVFSILFGIGYGLLADACASNKACIQTAITAKTTSSADRTSDLLKYALASVAPVPGLDKMQTELRAPIFGQHGWIAVTAVVLEIFHKIVALVMTFLFALALRNLFKMKS